MEENNWLVEQEKRKIIEDHNTNKRCKSADVLKENIPEDDIRKLLKKYEKREVLESLCERVLIQDQTGVYISPDKFKLNCQKKKPRPPHSSGLQQKSVDKTKTTFGQGRIGVAHDKFGRKICSCCNSFNSDYMHHGFCYNNPFYVPPYSFLEEPLNLSQTPDRHYPIDLSQPGCSGINNFPTPVNTSDIKFESVDPSISSTIVKSEQAVNDFSVFMDFINSEMDTFNSQHNYRTIEDTRSDIDVLVDENAPSPVPNMETDIVINNLSNDFNDFTCLMRPSTAIEPETIDLTSYTPKLSRAIDTSKEIIEVPDEIPIMNKLKPGIIEYINLDDSDDEVTTTVTINDSVISVNDSICGVQKPAKKGKSKKRISVEEEKAPDKMSTKTNLDCPVCLESLKNKQIVSTICGHIFCAPCAKSVIRRTKSCPNCRKSLSSKSIHPIYLNFD